MNKYLEVVQFGHYYYPAFRHYGKEVDVCCDKCGKQKLVSCIGYGQMDLCLKCASDVADPPKDNNWTFTNYEHPFNGNQGNMMR